MHEVALVQALIEQVAQEIAQSGCTGAVRRVELVVGRLSGAHPDSLRFAFELLAPGTVVEKAELAIDQQPAECACAACGARQPIDELPMGCPVCGSSRITIEGGRDLLLQSIELDDAPPADPGG